MHKNTVTLLTSVAMGVGALPCLADYASTVLGDAPVAYYRLNDNALTPPPYMATNLGSLGAAGHGVYFGAYVRPVEGAIAGDTASSFSNPSLGTSATAYINSVTTNSALNPSGGFTIEFWAKPSNNTAALLSPVSSMSFSPGRAGYLFYQNGATWQFRIGVNANTSPSTINGGTVVASQWQHIAGVYTGGSSGTMTLYVDGVQVATAAASYDPATNAPFCIGATASPNRTFDGSVDEVVFYDKVLSAGTIAAHQAARTTNAPNYAGQILAEAPVGYWRLNEPADVFPVATNSGSLGAANNGAYRYWSANVADLSAPTFPGFSTGNTVLQTSGTNGIVTIPALNLNTNTVTMECWIKRNGAQASYAGVLFHRGSAGGTATGIDFNGSNNTLGYHWNDTSSSYNWNSGLTPPDGVWTYVALAVKPDQATMYMYDGTNWSSAVNTTTHAVQAFADTTRIGADSSTSRFFNGLVDEAAIYSQTLTEAQLRTHALAGFGDPGHNRPTLVTDPPVLSPNDGVIYTTTAFSLTVDAYGLPPLSYQWLFNGTPIAAATQRSFVRPSAALSDAGNYSVIVSNQYGSVTSSAVAVGIIQAVAPTIVADPVSRTVFAGNTASFRVIADGTTPFRYQWKHAGTNLPGATNATLVLTGCTTAQAGAYSVGVTNIVGGAVSATATLTVSVPTPGSYVEKVVTNGPVAYWRLNDTSDLVATDSLGGYDATNVGGVFVAQPGPRPPAVVGFESGNLACQFDGGVGTASSTGIGLLNNVTNFSLCGWINPTTIKQSGFFGQNDVVEFRFNGSQAIELWTTKGSLTYAASPNITAGSWYFLAAVGTSTTLKLYVNGQLVQSATATATSGYGTSTYGFLLSGNTSGNNDPALDGLVDEVAVYKTALSDEAIAALYVAGAYGTTTPPRVVSSPGSRVMPARGNLTLTAGIVGSTPIAYQWKKDGVAIVGATSSSLTLSSLYYTDAGSYVLWATNAAGFTNTAGATLTVMPVPAFANLTNDLVAHLRFDGDYLDASGHANDATAPAGDPTFVAGKVGQGVHIASTTSGNYLALADNGVDLVFDETASFSVGFWVKYAAGFNDVPIIGNAKGSTWQIGWVFTDSGTAGKMEWSIASTANNGTYLRDPVPNCPTINDGAWHHVVGVVDRVRAETAVFIDGVQASSWSIAGLGSLSSGYQTVIGSDPTGIYGAATFDMDDLGIWRRALTDYEVASIFSAAQDYGNSFDVNGPVKVGINQTGSNVDVSWQAGTLLQSSSIGGPYTPVPGASAPFYRTSATNSAMFFRVQR